MSHDKALGISPHHKTAAAAGLIDRYGFGRAYFKTVGKMALAIKNIPGNSRPVASGPIQILLPFIPPSTNGLFANVRGGGRVKTTEYDTWLAQTGLLVRAQCKTRMAERCDIIVVLEDCHATADASNYIKAIEDLLVKVGVIENDNAKYVKSVRAVWADIEGCRVEIWPCDPHSIRHGGLVA